MGFSCRLYYFARRSSFPYCFTAFRKQLACPSPLWQCGLGITQQTLSALERNADKVSADRCWRFF